MRVVLQRVGWARVEVAGREAGVIAAGLLALVGVAEGDDASDARRLADKTVRLRLFAGEGRPFDRALTEVPGAGLLCVSQFTLLADVRRGSRPSWARAARPDLAAPLVEVYADAVAGHGVPVARGVFGAAMTVSLENDGPVTLVLDSDELSGPRRG